MQYTFPSTYGEDCNLVQVDTSLVPLISAALNKFQTRHVWMSDADHEAGYNAFAKLQAELMGNCVKTLQMEIRALRGVDNLSDAVYDPAADPFALSLGNLADNQRELERITAKLEAIRLLLEAMQNAETLDAIKAGVAQIAVLLA